LPAQQIREVTAAPDRYAKLEAKGIAVDDAMAVVLAAKHFFRIRDDYPANPGRTYAAQGRTADGRMLRVIFRLYQGTADIKTAWVVPQ
jgi:hypothetical protein